MKNVLFLVGPHASGKTYSTRKVMKEQGLNNTIMIDTGPIMRKLHKENSPETSIVEWVENLEKQYGKDATSELISGEIGRVFASTNCDNCILIGFRSLKGILYTIDRLNIDSYSILYVDASFELLYKNFMSRGDKDMSKEEFNEYLIDELNTGLGVMKNMALNSTGLIDYYYRESNDDEFGKEILKYIGTEPKLVKRREKE